MKSWRIAMSRAKVLCTNFRQVQCGTQQETWPRTWKSEIGSQGNRYHISDGFACQFKYI